MASVVTESNGMDRYKRLEKLGEGTYGLVYKAQDLVRNRFVAIKKIKLDNNEEGIPATTMREISLLSHLNHPNIIEMDTCLYVNGELFLVFEFMACDLKGYIDNFAPNGYIDTLALKKFTYYLTEGIRFCHTRRILHRDLKPQNILISDDGKLKIADFGLGREHGLPIAELTHEVVTLWYRPPEILLGKQKYSGACDVWGIGCIMAEMATKIPLFPGDSEIDQLFQIYRVLGTPNEAVWPGISALPEYKPVGPKWKKKDLGKELNDLIDPDGIDLLEQMLIFPPNKRITAKQVLCHRWFDEVRQGMIAEFGNIYPHCGSKEYQLERFKHQNKENVNKMNEDRAEEEEDEDYDQDADVDDDDDDIKPKYNKNDRELDAENESDDCDEDITGNAEEWTRKRRKQSQPMDVEDK